MAGLKRTIIVRIYALGKNQPITKGIQESGFLPYVQLDAARGNLVCFFLLTFTERVLFNGNELSPLEAV